MLAQHPHVIPSSVLHAYLLRTYYVLGLRIRLEQSLMWFCQKVKVLVTQLCPALCDPRPSHILGTPVLGFNEWNTNLLLWLEGWWTNNRAVGSCKRCTCEEHVNAYLLPKQYEKSGLKVKMHRWLNISHSHSFQHAP